MRSVQSRLLLVLLFLMLSACNIIGGAASILAPPQKIEAKHKLADKPTLILIDDRQGLVNNESLIRRIAGATRGVLEAEQVVTTGFVGQDELASLRQQLGAEFDNTSLAALAMKLGAKQVIHAEVVAYQMEIGNNLLQPSITLNIKVFDIDERKRVFPTDADPGTAQANNQIAYPLSTSLPMRDFTGQSAASAIAARELADLVGRDMGRLFFDWRVPEGGADLDQR